MTTTIYISPDGTEHRTLPRTWRNTTNITEAWALAHGWTTETRDVPEPPKRYSKYALHKALDNAGIWEAAWSAISTSGYGQYWNDAQELASDDAIFASALSALSASVGRGDIELPEGATIESILAEAEI